MSAFSLTCRPFLQVVGPNALPCQCAILHFLFFFSSFFFFFLGLQSAMLPEAVRVVNLLVTKGHRVYVHCTAGINRATLVVVAYLYFIQGLRRDEALKMVKQGRPIANPYLDCLTEAKRRLLGQPLHSLPLSLPLGTCVRGRVPELGRPMANPFLDCLTEAKRRLLGKPLHSLPLSFSLGTCARGRVPSRGGPWPTPTWTASQKPRGACFAKPLHSLPLSFSLGTCVRGRVPSRGSPWPTPTWTASQKPRGACLVSPSTPSPSPFRLVHVCVGGTKQGRPMANPYLDCLTEAKRRLWYASSSPGPCPPPSPVQLVQLKGSCGLQ